MKLILTTCLLLSLNLTGFSQALKLMSWNLHNFGESTTMQKMQDISDVTKMVDPDILAIQEISTTKSMNKKLNILVNLMNDTGSNRDYTYILSKKTTGPGTECYAIIYDKNEIEFLISGLTIELSETIMREPQFMDFVFFGDTITLYNLHLVPKDKNPSVEIAAIAKHLSHSKNFIVAGDFNLPLSNHVYDKFWDADKLILDKTSLKTKMEFNNYLSESYDHFIIHKNFTPIEFQVVDLVMLKTYNYAKSISDHLPIETTIILNK